MKYLAALAFLSGVAASTTAEPTEPTTDPDSSSRREVRFETQAYKATIEADNRDENVRDRLKFEFSTEGSGAAFRVEYYSQSDDVDAKARLRAKLYKLIEFTDANGDKIPQPEEINQEYPLDKDNWSEMADQRVDTTADDPQQTFSFSVPTLDGVVSLEAFYSNEDFITGQGYRLSPNNVKFNVRVNNFPYQETNSMLALQLRFRTRDETIVKTEGEVSTDPAAAESAQLYWVPEVTCNGAEITVLTSSLAQVTAADDDSADPVPEGDSDNDIFFTFDSPTQCTTLFWDPEIAATFSTPKPSGDANPAATWAPSLLLALGGFLRF